MKKLVVLLFIACAMMTCFLTSCNKENGQQANNQKEVVKTGKKVYFAGPMFNQAEKDFNLKIAQILEEFGYTVFLPQRDGIEGALLEGKTEEELVEIIFPLDVEHVLEADIIFI